MPKRAPAYLPRLPEPAEPSAAWGFIGKIALPGLVVLAAAASLAGGLPKVALGHDIYTGLRSPDGQPHVCIINGQVVCIPLSLGA
jgi:hypothetical protein